MNEQKKYVSGHASVNKGNFCMLFSNYICAENSMYSTNGTWEMRMKRERETLFTDVCPFDRSIVYARKRSEI
jgi:hypothetical protein